LPRIEAPKRPGTLLARLAFWLTRRRTGKVVTPVRLHALHSAVLFGYGQMELAQDKARRVPADLKALGQVRVALRVGCPF
jgi:hypothetical protein